MTAGKLLHPPGDEHVELNTSRSWSPPIKPTAAATVVVDLSPGRRSSGARKRPRTSSLTTSSSTALSPYPPHSSNYCSGQAATSADELVQTRPRRNNPFLPAKRGAASEADLFRPTQLPHLGDGRDDGGGDGSSFSGSADSSSARLSRSAKVLEEDRKKVASIRSFLLNFLEERDCSIKKRLVGTQLLKISPIGVFIRD